MPNQSYSFDKLAVTLSVHPHNEFFTHKDLYNLDDFVHHIGQFVSEHANLFAVPTHVGENDDFDTPVSGKSHPQFLDYVRSSQTRLPEPVRKADPSCLAMSPNVFCYTGMDWLAINIDATFAHDDMERMGQPMPSGEQKFHFSRWWFAARDGARLDWKDIDHDRVQVSVPGVIKREGLSFHPRDWAWPKAAWMLTGEMKADAILRQLISESESNPLTSIIKSKHPYRGNGLRIASDVKAALKALDRPR